MYMPLIRDSCISESRPESTFEPRSCYPIYWPAKKPHTHIFPVGKIDWLGFSLRILITDPIGRAKLIRDSIGQNNFNLFQNRMFGHSACTCMVVYVALGDQHARFVPPLRAPGPCTPPRLSKNAHLKCERETPGTLISAKRPETGQKRSF